MKYVLISDNIQSYRQWESVGGMQENVWIVSKKIEANDTRKYTGCQNCAIDYRCSQYQIALVSCLSVLHHLILPLPSAPRKLTLVTGTQLVLSISMAQIQARKMFLSSPGSLTNVHWVCELLMKLRMGLINITRTSTMQRMQQIIQKYRQVLFQRAAKFNSHKKSLRSSIL